MKILEKFKNKKSPIKDYLLEPFYKIKNVLVRKSLLPKLKEKISEINVGQNNSGFNRELEKEIFLASSYRLDSKIRQDIFQVSMQRNLENLNNLSMRVADASPEGFFESNREFLNKFSKIKAESLPIKARLTASYKELLKNAPEKYFCMLFDDMPIIGMSDEFLTASIALLNDFENLVSVVLAEQITEFAEDKEKKTITFKQSDLEFILKDKKPVGIVKYGKFSFAILENNYHYGFFFNTLIAPCKDYLDKLEWYMNNVSQESPHKIELAGMRGKGPVINFIAVPLDVFMVDIDFAHSDTSIRGVGENTKRVFEDLQNNFVVEYLK